MASLDRLGGEEVLYEVDSRSLTRKMKVGEVCLYATTARVYRAGDTVYARVCTVYDDQMYCVEEDITDVVGRVPKVLMKVSRELARLCGDDRDCIIRNWRRAVAENAHLAVPEILGTEHVYVTRACEAILAAIRLTAR